MLRAFLDYHRATFATKCDGLMSAECERSRRPAANFRSAAVDARIIKTQGHCPRGR
jgi:hypothetical protein